jgi:deoxyxylulose-5-phosphate synthase
MGFPDDFIPHGSVNILLKKYKLDVEGIIENILKAL